MSKKARSGIKRSGKTGSAIPEAKTIAEANALAVRLGLAKEANFTGMDIDHANLVIQTLISYKADFPALQQLDSIKAENFRKESTMAKNVATLSRRTGELIGDSLFFNTKYFSSKNKDKLSRDLQDMVGTKDMPIGCGTVKSIIDHEMGHALTFLCPKGRIDNDSVIKKLYRRNGGKNSEKMQDNVSSYASTSTREFIAEAWSEYRNNPNPRPAAKAVGARIEELYS